MDRLPALERGYQIDVGHGPDAGVIISQVSAGSTWYPVTRDVTPTAGLACSKSAPYRTTHQALLSSDKSLRTRTDASGRRPPHRVREVGRIRLVRDSECGRAILGPKVPDALRWRADDARSDDITHILSRTQS